MKTKAILIAALVSAGLMFTACNKGGEPSPVLTVYPKDDPNLGRSDKQLHPEVIEIRGEKEKLDQSEEQALGIKVYPQVIEGSEANQEFFSAGVKEEIEEE